MVWAGVVALGWVLVTSSCARPVAPTGGPRDVIPPMIASTWPEPFEVIEPTRDPVKIVFNERISERPTEGSLDNAVSVSPETGEHQVKHIAWPLLITTLIAKTATKGAVNKDHWRLVNQRL